MVTSESEGAAGRSSSELPSLALYPDRLKFAMDRAKLSTSQLARAINCSVGVISNMRGRKNPTYSGPFLKQVAAALDVPAEWLAWNNEPGSFGSGAAPAGDDVVAELATIVARLIARKVMSRNEVIAMIGQLRIRESEA
ncbi:helix-turn-helix transcriptional regulator [Burkholderia sp. Ac-20365]|uniref:helix-turn-helix domain-containing protein n=1 Tax=Burkholderia sp. Ac-20365 TaxID=2703897 RepID=UPI00197C6091|nr:helix-turn-helix transcriptional regulator [Burkholderia sp. Ac-20365]MBN3761013.1 helix-turn-helix transcriptional regulator [Burkholderia sp. Ac-20365]